MIPVLETSQDVFEPLSGNPILLSVDGNRRAPLQVVLHESWTAQDRADFGVYLVAPFVVPEGKITVGSPTYERVNDVVIQTYTVSDPPPPTAEEQRQADFIAELDRADLANRLANDTPAQIDLWIDDNVTTFATTRARLKQIIKLLVSGNFNQ